MSRIHPTRPGVVMPVRIDPAGLVGPTPGQARGPRWRSSGHGWHVPTDVDPTLLEQRIVEAVVGVGGTAAATGWAALAWQGARWFSGHRADGTPLDVPVAIGDRRSVRTCRGAQLSEDWLFDDDVIDVDGLPITVPHRSVTFEARRATSLHRAVQAIDMAAADDLIDLASLDQYVARLSGRSGVAQPRWAASLADENAWSPTECTMRVYWEVEGRHGRPLCNAPIFSTDGQHLLTPDLFDPRLGVAGEYDGAVHDADDVRRRDLDREELARAHGIETVTMMAGDLREPGRFLRRLRAAYGRAAARPRAPRSWTLEQPSRWVDTSTVAARRALSAVEREIWLLRTPRRT